MNEERYTVDNTTKKLRIAGPEEEGLSLPDAIEALGRQQEEQDQREYLGKRLHLGAGKVILPGWINVDIRDLPGINLVTPADKLEAFPDNTIDLIYACHVLEHYARRDTMRVLQEWRRVLKPEGTLRLSVPDFAACVQAYYKRAPLALLLGHIVGGQEYPGNAHLMVFDLDYLSTLLSEVGFRRIRVYDCHKTDHHHFDDRSMGYFPHMDTKKGLLMSLNMEADK